MAWTTPPTFSVGEIPTAAKFNQISDDLKFLKGSSGAITLDNHVLLGTSSLQFSTTTLARTFGSLLVSDSAASGRLLLVSSNGAQTFSTGPYLVFFGSAIGAGAALVLTHNTSTNVAYVATVVGTPTSGAVYLDAPANTLQWQVNGSGVIANRISGTASYVVTMLLLYS